MEQTLEIKVNPPKGWLAVDMRPPREGDTFVGVHGALIEWTRNYAGAGPRLIVVRKFEFPACVKKGTWYAVDADGQAFLYPEKPTLGEMEWHPSTHVVVKVDFARSVFDFPEAPKGDWKLSLQQKQ